MEYINPLPAQAIADQSILQPSAQFKKQVINVIWSLSLFIVIYILLFIVGIAIAAGMVVLGGALLMSMRMSFILILGIGLILSGLMLAYFLIKSIFIKSPQRANRYEITEDEQPELFAFIRQLTDKTGAPFPKHIFLSPEVNASVFFDSSFWSMFFPVRKNLVIGLGLVNCTNQSELRAVLAHEFGHFSQRSMRFGSYVYNFNQVIYNTLYENKGYEKMLNAWARWHNVLRLTAMLNIKIINLIQGTLRKMYLHINKAHLGLSREMEFHADAMAAYYGGAKNMAMALRRIEAGDDCYNQTLNILNQKMNEGYRSANVYPPHQIVLQRFAQEHQLQTDKNGMPVINKNIAALDNSRVIVQNQWASHPTMFEREEKLNDIDSIIETINEPAWSLFRDADMLQQHFTGQLYSGVKENYEDLKLLDTDTFRADFIQQYESNSYNDIYKGFYNNRLLNQFDVDEAIASAQDGGETFDRLFTDENCNLPQFIIGMRKDIGHLEIVGNKENKDLISFDFEGVRYDKTDAAAIKAIIEKQITDTEQQIAELDRRIFIFFYQQAQVKGMAQSLADQYKQALTFQSLAKPDYDSYNEIMDDMSPIYSKLTPDVINDTLSKVYYKERNVKPRIQEVIADTTLLPFITEAQKKDMETYLSKNWVYYSSGYDNNALNVFNKGINAFVQVIAERSFRYKKDCSNFSCHY